MKAFLFVLALASGLLAAAAPIPTLSSPSNNALLKDSSVVLSWNSVNFGSSTSNGYGYQISTASDFSSTVLSMSPIAVNPPYVTLKSSPVIIQFNNKTYYWHVNAIQGSLLSAWSTAWSFTMWGVPDAPVLSSPSNGSQLDSAQLIFDQASSTRDLSLSWTAPARASTYNMCVSTSSDFSSGNRTGSLNGQTSTLLNFGGTNFQYEVQYYWRVSATNNAGTGPWSASSKFVVHKYVTVIKTPAHHQSAIKLEQSHLNIALRGNQRGVTINNKGVRYLITGRLIR